MPQDSAFSVSGATSMSSNKSQNIGGLWWASSHVWSQRQPGCAFTSPLGFQRCVMVPAGIVGNAQCWHLQRINTTITNNIKYWDIGCQVLHSVKKPSFLNAFHPPVSSGSPFPARCRQSVHVIWHSEFCFWIIVNFVTSLQKTKTFSIFWMDCSVSLFFDVTPLVMTSSGFSLCNTCHSMWWREPSHHPLVPSGSCQRYNCVLTWGLMKPPC